MHFLKKGPRNSYFNLEFSSKLFAIILTLLERIISKFAHLMIQQRAQNGQILKYSIASNMQIGGNYKNFHHALVPLWGNYKVFGQHIHPCFLIKTTGDI